jgi:uncharacterized protein
MIALDTNFLIHAHRIDSSQHERAFSVVRDLMQSGQAWGIPNPCVSEFLNIITHPKIFKQPTPVQQALEQMAAWLECPTGTILHSGSTFWSVLKQLAQAAQLRGGQYHDARIAAVCIENSVNVLWTIDRDFGRYKQLKAINPLL